MLTPSYANPQGDYELDEVFQLIKEHWRNGRQIVPLLGAGISIDSGVPAIVWLHEHLLTLQALREQQFHWRQDGAPDGTKTNTELAAYDLKRDGWLSPGRVAEHFAGREQKDVVADYLKKRFWTGFLGAGPGDVLKKAGHDAIDLHSNLYARGFASLMGKDWLALMEDVGEHRPEMVDIIFDALSSYSHPNVAHSLIAHCVIWFNVRLVLTTNFDRLVEQSLATEGLPVYAYDIHMVAPPPPKEVIERHLSVVKLHGSHYGLRADQSVNKPLERGHTETLLEYLNDDAILLCLGYGGAEKRITGFLQQILEKKEKATIIRVDPMVPGEDNFFYQECNSDRWITIDKNGKQQCRVRNIYYPPSAGLFLFHLYQYAANRLPNTRGRYPSVPHTASGLTDTPKLGFGIRKGATPRTSPQNRMAETILKLVKAPSDALKCALVWNESIHDSSQTIIHLYENLFASHQVLWCNANEATSIGTVFGWLHEFSQARQPDLPTTPLPITLPAFESGVPTAITSGEIEEIYRTVRVLWSRLERQKIAIFLDSLCYGFQELWLTNGSREDSRSQREALRLLILVAVLMKFAHDSDMGRCLLFISVHHPLKKGGTFSESAKVLLTDDTLEFSETSLTGDVWKRIKIHLEQLISPKQKQDKKTVFKATKVTGRAVPSFPDKRRGSDPHALLRLLEGKGFTVDKKNWVRTDQSSDAELGAFEGWPNEADHYLIPFLVESAHCNRPRSWRQLMQLPIIKTMGQQYDGTGKETIDKRSKSLAWMIAHALNRGFFDMQPGGFFSIEGTLRNFLRDGAKSLKAGDKWLVDSADVHKRMAEYFRRIYNQSRDVAALNHYFWHRLALLDTIALKKKDKQEAIETTVDQVLENALSARGYLYAYDHCFLLLHLDDLLNKHQDAFSMLQDIEQGGEVNRESNRDQRKYHALRLRVLSALGDVYDDNADAKNGESVAEAILKSANEVNRLRLLAREPGAGESARGTNAIGPAQAYFRLQKAHWQQLNASRSCYYALAGLHQLFKADVPTHDLAEVTTALDLDPKLVTFTNLRLILRAICYVVGLDPEVDLMEAQPSKKYDLTARAVKIQDRYLLIHQASQRIVAHRIILRLVRSLIRLHKFGAAAKSPTTGENGAELNLISHLCDILIEFGVYTNTGSDVSCTEIKLLEARYLTARALRALYRIGEKDEKDVPNQTISLRTTYYNHQAQANAIQAEGLASLTHEAKAVLDDAEALLWTARLTLWQKITDLRAHGDERIDVYNNAAARQEAALRHFEQVQVRLGQGTASLPTWQELAALRAGATADILKRLTCQYLEAPPIEPAKTSKEEPLPKQKTPLSRQEALLQFATQIEKAGFELGHLLPLVVDDPWRGSRTSIQIYRITVYGVRIFNEMLKELDEPNQSSLDLVVALDTVGRAINNMSLSKEVCLPLLPLKPLDAAQHQEFIEKMWKNLAICVCRIDAWTGRLLNPTSEHWREISRSHELSVKRWEHCRASLCFEQFEVIADSPTDPTKEQIQTLQRTLRKLNKPDQPTRGHLFKWPRGYGAVDDLNAS